MTRGAGLPGAGPAVATLLAAAAIAGSVAWAAAEPGGPRTPVPIRSPEARIWSKLNEAAQHAAAAPGAPRSIAVGDVAYPRTAAEAETLGGQALLLVSTMADQLGKVRVERATLHYEDGEEADLAGVTAQTNDIEGSEQAAVRLVGQYRHDALFFIPSKFTATKAHVTATFAGRTEVVLRFPRKPSAYPSTVPEPEPGLPKRMAEWSTIARTLYPFFRVAPLRAPGAEPTCALHSPANPLPTADDVKRIKPSAGDKSKTIFEPAAGAAPGTATVQGSLDKEVIRGVIRAHIAEVKACYETELAVTPQLAARVMVQFTIAGDGWVVSSVLQKSSVDNARLNDCVVAVVRCWRFPKPIGGGIVIVSYPFVLTPAGAESK